MQPHKALHHSRRAASSFFSADQKLFPTAMNKEGFPPAILPPDHVPRQHPAC